MMLQPRLRSSPAAAELSLNSLAAALNSIALCPKHAASSPGFTFVRYASHASQGRANGPKDSAGRRLGAKKTASEYVIPGNIIYKQRGTKWFPGENVGIGKDHTIFAKVAGYVRYYRNPGLHPKRRYIGVALEKEGPASTLPTPPNAPTRRRLGMYATPIKEPTSAETDRAFLEAHMSADSLGDKGEDMPPRPSASIALQSAPLNAQPGLTMRPGGFRVANFEIGRAAERKGVKVKEFNRKDRWTAWRKRAKKVKEKMAARAARANRKGKGKKANKAIPKTNV